MLDKGAFNFTASTQIPGEIAEPANLFQDGLWRPESSLVKFSVVPG